MPVGELSFAHPGDGTLVVRLAGRWRLREGLPPVGAVERELATGQASAGVRFDTADLTAWDSGLLTFVTQVGHLCDDRGVPAVRDGLPAGLRQLLALAEGVPEKTDARSEKPRVPLLERVGELSAAVGGSLGESVTFLGDATLALGRFVTRRARYRAVDLWYLIQQAGAEALPIVTLVSFLLGVILAFVGAVQLQQFGATIYVANLVGVGMVRDMAALITGIAMAGRSGAAFAAQLGTMKVNQEIDALNTAGVSPLDFLVLPRLVALMAMMPALTLYSQFMGIVGGAVVGVTMLDISVTAYVQQTTAAISIPDLLGGVFKGSAYGVLIALAGCLRGMQAAKSSAGVGDAATSAVVTGIVAIIAACGLFQFVFYLLGW